MTATVHNPELGDANEFLKKHFGLVYHIAHKFARTSSAYGIGMDELSSAGKLALVKAYKTFNSGSGAKWATYATTCIENEFKMLLRKGRKRLMETSLDAPLNTDNDGNELTFSDLLVGTPDVDSSETMVKEFVSQLKPRHAEILEMRMRGCQQNEIADQFGLSQSYIARILQRIGNQYLKGEWKVARPIKGNVELAKQLIVENNKSDEEIVDETGVVLPRVRMLRGEMSVTYRAKAEPVITTRPTPTEVRSQPSLIERISDMQSRLLGFVEELETLKSDVTNATKSQEQMIQAAKQLLGLVG